MAGRHAHEPGVRLVDRAFLGVGVLVLDDAHDVAGAVAHDAAVAGRIGQHHAQQADRVRSGGSHQARQRIELHHRHVAVEHEHLVIVRDQRHRLRDRVPGAVLLRLQHPLHGAALECDQHLLAAVPVDDVRRGRLQAHATYRARGRAAAAQPAAAAPWAGRTSCACPGRRPGSRRKGALRHPFRGVGGILPNRAPAPGA